MGAFRHVLTTSSRFFAAHGQIDSVAPAFKLIVLRVFGSLFITMSFPVSLLLDRLFTSSPMTRNVKAEI